MNFGALKERVIRFIDRDDTNIDSIVGDFINDARAMIACLYNFDYLYTVDSLNFSSGNPLVPLPSDYLNHIVIHYQSTEILPLTSFNLKDFITASSGTPQFFQIEGTNIRLFPTPNSEGTLVIRYYRQPAPFTSDSDYDYITNNYFMVVIFYACALGCLWVEDERYSAFMNLYQYEKNQMLMREVHKVEQRKSVVEDSTWPLRLMAAAVGQQKND